MNHQANQESPSIFFDQNNQEGNLCGSLFCRSDPKKNGATVCSFWFALELKTTKRVPSKEDEPGFRVELLRGHMVTFILPFGCAPKAGLRPRPTPALAIGAKLRTWSSRGSRRPSARSRTSASPAATSLASDWARCFSPGSPTTPNVGQLAESRACLLLLARAHLHDNLVTKQKGERMDL